MSKKYEFTGEERLFDGRILYRIRYLKKGKDFFENELGGWIESEDNLSHEGNCCVLGFAKVYDNARITENAIIEGVAIVKDNAKIMADSLIHGNSIIGADTIISCSVKSNIDNSEIFFYKQLINKKELKDTVETNISGKTVIDNSGIEATGTIFNSTIKNKELFGFLNMKNL